MANSILRFSDKGSKAYHALGLLCLMLLMQNSSAARDFLVHWNVPSNNSASFYNQWAGNNRFQIGDSLVFNYSSGQDSVLEVTKDAYENCRTESPLGKFTDGLTVFTFNRSGPFFFISGNKDNCLKFEKLIVVVLADRSKHVAPALPSPGAEPPVIYQTPAPAPTPGAAASTFIGLINSFGVFAAAAAASLLLAF